MTSFSGADAEYVFASAVYLAAGAGLVTLLHFDRSLGESVAVAAAALLLLPTALFVRYLRWPATVLLAAMSVAQAAFVGSLFSSSRPSIGAAIGAVIGAALAFTFYRKLLRRKPL